VTRNLQLFEGMKSEIEVTGSMTEEAKRRKRNRLLRKMKLEKLVPLPLNTWRRHVFIGRGRKLKS